jgi:GNAT superfamily N-acetyltransferase
VKPANCIVRAATAADLPHVVRLVRGLAEYERKLHEFVIVETDLHQLLFGPVPRAYAMLAEPVGNAPVGIALFYYTISTFSGRNGIFLEDLFVDPAYRGGGIGRALLRELAVRAQAENCHIIEWRVLNWNQPAIDFYDRIGATQMRDWHVRQLGGAALAALAEGATNG